MTGVYACIYMYFAGTTVVPASMGIRTEYKALQT